MTEDYYFWSHRLLIAKAAQRADFDVYVVTHVDEYGDKIKKAIDAYHEIYQRRKLTTREAAD